MKLPTGDLHPSATSTYQRGDTQIQMHTHTHTHTQAASETEERADKSMFVFMRMWSTVALYVWRQCQARPRETAGGRGVLELEGDFTNSYSECDYNMAQEYKDEYLAFSFNLKRSLTNFLWSFMVSVFSLLSSGNVLIIDMLIWGLLQLPRNCCYTWLRGRDDEPWTLRRLRAETNVVLKGHYVVLEKKSNLRISIFIDSIEFLACLFTCLFPSE